MTNTLVTQLEHQPGVEFAFLLNPKATLGFYRRLLARMAARDVRGARSLTRRMVSRLHCYILNELAGGAHEPARTEATP